MSTLDKTRVADQQPPPRTVFSDPRMLLAFACLQLLIWWVQQWAI